ncbi:hypothetical protein F5148DRAFT_134881 [Russula earlei]|uniref:Uncharacterized protein n=1 Tax=Russula earlei TaxID=71964 RepID=A0ACC0U7B8_9AGAM|nr:hypothetical protein F5148DRAFT_134881 [Russula earlei]
MPVTTRRQSRALLHSSVVVESERRRTGGMPSIAREDSLDVPLPGSSSVERDSAHESVWGDLESDCSEESDPDGNDNTDFDDDFGDASGAVTSGKASSSSSPAKSKRAGTSRRVKGRLQNMLLLPLDALFMIFSKLGPMDLVNLSRTSKDLRQLLMSRKSMWVWITARQKAGATSVPDPPEDMSEPAWALLLFGPAVCSECSRQNIHRVDFALRRRLCIPCRKRNLVFSPRFRSHCPGLKESVMDLLPYTRIGGWTQWHASSSRFYWKPDLYEMGKKLAELEEDRDAGKPGARQRLKSFRAERILLVDSVVQSSAEFEKWAKVEAGIQAQNYRERRMQRREALKERILASGFDSVDLNWIGWSAVPGANVDKPLTEKVWKYIRNKVEIKLNAARKARLFAERCQRERIYHHKSTQCYSDLLRQVLPMQRLYLPSLSQVDELSCFRELRNPDRDEQPAEWVHAAAQLPESLSEWMSERRSKCTGLLPFYVDGPQDKAMEVKMLSDPTIDLWRHDAMGNFAGKLDLAISVFRHPDTSTIHIGRDVCHAWKMKGELEFSERGAEAVGALLRLLGLDPAITTASMLERLDMYFVCASCPPDLVESHRSWISCVLHFLQSSETDHPYPEWRVASHDEAAMPCEHVIGCHPVEPKAWLCNRCSDYPETFPFATFGLVTTAGSKGDAIRHVQTAHNIEDPVTDVDLFSYPILRFN